MHFIFMEKLIITYGKSNSWLIIIFWKFDIDVIIIYGILMTCIMIHFLSWLNMLYVYYHYRKKPIVNEYFHEES